jgi:hypothetical protein
MFFGIIDPSKKRRRVIRCSDIIDAQRRAEIGSGVDHGVVTRGAKGGVGIVVSEFGLFEPKETQGYFAIGQRLYAGIAVLYGFDAYGETTDLDGLPDVRWFDDAADVERSITMKLIMRPSMAANGQLIWQWPEPKPDFSAIFK